MAQVNKPDKSGLILSLRNAKDYKDVNLKTKASIQDIASLRSAPRWVCRLNIANNMLCTKTASLLASYDQEMIKVIVNGINNLVASGTISPNAAAVGKCPDGRWVGLNIPSQNNSHFKEHFKNRCEQNKWFANWSTSSNSNRSNIPGNGINFGSVGLTNDTNSCLSMEIKPQNSIMFDSLMGILRNCMDDSDNQNIDPMGLVSEGGSDSSGSPDSADEESDDEPKELGPSDDATVEEETTTYEDGRTTTRTTWSDGTVTEVTTDSEGNTTVVVTGAPEEDSDNSRSGGYVVDSEGNVTSSYVQISDEDGNMISVTHYDGDGNITSYEDSSGRTSYFDEGQYFKINSDGSWDYRYCYLGDCYTRHRSKELVDKLFKARQNSSFACNELEQTCMSKSCTQAIQTYFGAQEACAGSNNQFCTDYTSASSCCQNSSPGNPLVAMPNPEGPLYCTSASVSPSTSICEKRCGVASPTDTSCVQQCIASATVEVLPYDMIEASCIYMYSEACFDERGPLNHLKNVPDMFLPSPLGNNSGVHTHLLFERIDSP
ncbi:hypothetical protein GCM10017044_15520 [Kordiimonas sediminis]|uniref:RHS repeat protein n=1 Tax=Kordiimonas sediminis TaxID=1735581 RepID=A0A919E5V1_9PROT|nr:hypothetical protein GCM10017044_15520 [Kordiimonas sediminis]